jgi:acyl-CoA synthetase (AMP-forming)/AMP-acid ligase II
MATLDIELSKFHEQLRGLSLPEALDLAAEVHGSSLAIKHIEGGGPSLTWAEFRAVVARLAAGLAHAGVKAGDRVGVQLPNQLEFPLTWFAAASLGAAIIPLNPKYTARERDFVLGDADATWLVGASDLVTATGADGQLAQIDSSHIIAVGPPVPGTIAFNDLLSRTAVARLAYPSPDEVVNIQFTSGTTGLPKGCLLSHRYWIELGVWTGALFGEEHTRRILADHPFYYMQNQGYLLLALANGGAAVVTAGPSRRKFMGWLVDHGITHAWVDEEMLESPAQATEGALLMKRAPIMAVSPEGQRRIEERFDLSVRDYYASTEAGNGTFVPWNRPDLAERGAMGLLFPTRESKLVDEDLVEVSTGEVGELCLRGEGMMLGYHNRPEDNAELMLPGGWFRTGDLACKDADGVHFYKGRVKDMIQRSGENVSAVEVEQQILCMRDVIEVGVVPVPDASRGEEVKALVVLRDGARVTHEDVVEYARERLAPFKLPRYVEFRSELPRTASGKIHKAALKAEDPFTEATVDVTGERKS